MRHVKTVFDGHCNSVIAVTALRVDVPHKLRCRAYSLLTKVRLAGTTTAHQTIKAATTFKSWQEG